MVEGNAGKITGVVRDADGAPVADAFVEATRESESAAASAGGAMRDGRWGSFWNTPHLTDEDGRFTLPDLEKGKHSLRAHRKGGGEALLEHVEIGRRRGPDDCLGRAHGGHVTLKGGGSPEEFKVKVEDETDGLWPQRSLLPQQRGVEPRGGAGRQIQGARERGARARPRSEATMVEGKDTRTCAWSCRRR